MIDLIPTATAIIAELADHFVFNFKRYAIAATVIAILVWTLKRTAWRSRQIQKRSPGFADFRREFLASVGAIMVFAVLNTFLNWGFRIGIFHDYQGTQSLWMVALFFAAMTLGHDTYYYWTHRAMHTRLLFRTVHRYHHRSVTPSPWTAYSFSLPEAALNFIYLPVWLYFIPTPQDAIWSYVIFQIIRNTMQHAGLELHPRGTATHPIGKWIVTTTHHDMHHGGGFTHNYGAWFTFWDKLMGTEHPAYVDTFNRVTAPAGANVPDTPCPKGTPA